MIPRLTDIQSFSITMVPGRPIHGITSCAPFCGSDPFRGDDEWVINGFSIAVDPLGTWGGGTTGSDSLHYIFSRLNIGQKRNKHNLTWTSDPWMH